MDLERIRDYQRRFVAARRWNVYHTPKNLAAALAVEAAELLELFQWLTPKEALRLAPKLKKNLSDELADVLYYLVRIADVAGIDLEAAFWAKVEQNEKKYPVHLARGNAKKYNELREKSRRKKARSKGKKK